MLITLVNVTKNLIFFLICFTDAPKKVHFHFYHLFSLIFLERPPMIHTLTVLPLIIHQRHVIESNTGVNVMILIVSTRDVRVHAIKNKSIKTAFHFSRLKLNRDMRMLTRLWQLEFLRAHWHGCQFMRNGKTPLNHSVNVRRNFAFGYDRSF